MVMLEYLTAKSTVTLHILKSVIAYQISTFLFDFIYQIPYIYPKQVAQMF